MYDEDGTIIGEYIANLFVAGCLIIELKACQALANAHIAQLLGYMKSARIADGLLINFGSYKFQIRKYRLELGSQHTINDLMSECEALP